MDRGTNPAGEVGCPLRVLGDSAPESGEVQASRGLRLPPRTREDPVEEIFSQEAERPLEVRRDSHGRKDCRIPKVGCRKKDLLKGQAASARGPFDEMCIRDSTIVWDYNGLDGNTDFAGAAKPSSDTVYNVQVNDVVINGIAQNLSLIHI